MQRLLLVVLLVGLVSLTGCASDDTNSVVTDRLESDTAPAAVSTDSEPNPADSADSAVTDGQETTSDAMDEPPSVREPLVTEGLVLHFETDSGVSTDGDTVTQWADQAGDNDLTAEGEPTLRSDALNGHDVVSFDGEDDLLNRSESIEGLPRLNEDRTMFAVVKYEGVGSGGLGYGRSFGGGNHAFQFTVDEDGLLELNAFGKPNDYTVPIDGTRDGWMTRAVTLEDGEFVHYMNGERYDSGTHEFDTKLADIIMGTEIDYEPKVDMQVAAMLVYDRSLDDSERSQVESYLQGKYLPEVATDTNARPTAGDDSVMVPEEGSVTVDILANDEDPDGTLDADSVVAVNRSRGQRGPLFGSVTVNSDGTITYDHAGECTVDFYPCGSEGTDTFTYTVLDEDGAPSNVATVSITIENESFDLNRYDTDGDGSIVGDTTGVLRAIEDHEDGYISLNNVLQVITEYNG